MAIPGETMRAILVLFILLISMIPAVQAEEAKTSTAKKSKINTELFDQDAEAGTASGKVKAIREVQEETEVFIDNPKGSSGPYVLPTNFKNRAGAMKILNKSQKPGGPPVTLTYDGQQKIRSVEE
jgi:hypothetical protein